MSIAAEFEAALPEPRSILGVRLLPLSLGRYRMLKRFDCPFVDDDAREETTQSLTKELFFALLICGLPVGEFKELLMQPKRLAKEARRFGRTAAKVVKRTENFSILPLFDDFKKYLAAGTDMPWHPLERDQIGGESVSHWSHSMEVTLRSKAGWTQHEIDEEPMAKAMADFFKLMESEGVVDLVTHEDYEILRKSGEDNARILLEWQAAQNAQN